MTDRSTTPYRLSKSKIAAFEHCPKRLWLQFHRREAARIDTATQALFNFGHAVGARALSSFPEGVMIEAEPDMDAALARTAGLISVMPRRPLFEATFQYEDVLVRVDILVPDSNGRWCALEVKASNTVKAYQVADLATQIWVMEGCGVSISRAYIRHIAKPFSWQKPSVARVRFRDADVTKPVRRLAAKRHQIIAAAREAARGPEIDRAMGPHCEHPMRCEFREHCRALRNEPLFARIDGN